MMMGRDGMVVSSSTRFLLPYAPQNTNEWTEDMYLIYHEVQATLGLRQEPTEEEVKAEELTKEIDEAIASGENWIDMVREYFGEDYEDSSEFDMLIGDEEFVENLGNQMEKERGLYGEVIEI